MNDHIDTILETTTPRQTTAGREQLYVRVMTKAGLETPAVGPVPSPYVSLSVLMRTSRVYVAALLIIILGTSGTVAASESAKPGDVLFPIERATEQVRLALASEEKRQVLESRFLDKRFAEVSALLDEETFLSTSSDRRLVSTRGELRIADAIAILLTQAERLPSAEQSERLGVLLREIEAIGVDGRADDRDDERRIRIDDDRIEVRTETERIRIENKDGEMRMRYDTDDDDNKDDDDDDRANTSYRTESYQAVGGRVDRADDDDATTDDRNQKSSSEGDDDRLEDETGRDNDDDDNEDRDDSDNDDDKDTKDDDDKSRDRDTDDDRDDDHDN